MREVQPRGRGGERDPSEDHRAPQPRGAGRSRRPGGPRARAPGRGAGRPGGHVRWNNQRHLEAYLAIPCMGAVLHTLNLRLFAEQLAYIINHAEDRVIIVDARWCRCWRLAARARVRASNRGDRRAATRPACGDVAPLRGAARGPGPRAFDWPELDERQAAAMCYTSGTTGNPGRRVQPPLDLPALDRHAIARGLGLGERRPGAGHRADVPRQRLGPPLRGRAGRAPT